THLADYPGREVLHHHVDLRDHREHDLPGARLAQVDGEAALGVIVLDVVAAHPVADDSELADVIALGRAFDLDHVGAHLGKNPGAGGTGHVVGEIQNAITFEHPPSRFHRKS